MRLAVAIFQQLSSIRSFNKIEYTPCNDVFFKKIFGANENIHLLKSLINSVLPQNNQVESLVIENPYNMPNYIGDKMSILDIKACDQSGSKYNIEVQLVDTKDYQERALYYWARLYSGQMAESNSYKKLRPTIGIHLLRFDILPKEKDEYYKHFIIKDAKTNEANFFQHLQLYTIELSKFFNNIKPNLPVILNNPLDSWSIFLTSPEDIGKFKLHQAVSNDINAAANVFSRMIISPDERETMEYMLDYKRRTIDSITQSKKEGIEEASRNIVKKMKDSGIPTSEIMKYVDIDEASLEKI